MNSVSAPGAPSIASLHVLGQPCSITASKCVSKIIRSRPPSSHDPGLPSASVNLPNHSLQVHKIMAKKCISNLVRSGPQSASPSSRDHGLQTRSITTSKLAPSSLPTCICNLAQTRPPSSHHHGLQVCIQTRSITASRCISEFTALSFSSAPRTVL
jgi:hypothetical protein